MLKICSICSVAKLLDAAAKRNSKASGFNGARCWACYCAAYAKQRGLNRTKPFERAKHNAASRASARKHRGRVNATSTKRKVSKLLRTPCWADLEKIKLVYIQASQLGLEVDHVIPLQGKLVSGLHVHTNLQLLPKSENRKKGHRYEIK